MKKIITISREFGAGGGEIGSEVAQALGWEYYNNGTKRFRLHLALHRAFLIFIIDL